MDAAPLAMVGSAALAACAVGREDGDVEVNEEDIEENRQPPKEPLDGGKERVEATTDREELALASVPPRFTLCLARLPRLWSR